MKDLSASKLAIILGMIASQNLTKIHDLSSSGRNQVFRPRHTGSLRNKRLACKRRNQLKQKAVMRRVR